MKRPGRARIAHVEAARPRVPRVVVMGGPVAMTPRLAEIIRTMVDRQRARERG